MLKQFPNGRIITFPATSKTPIRVECENIHTCNFFTIIDVASVGKNTYALLENNLYGEEMTLLVRLPEDPYILRKWKGNIKGTHLGNEYQECIFLHSYCIIDDGNGNDIVTLLIDNDLDQEEIVGWTDDEINKEV